MKLLFCFIASKLVLVASLRSLAELLSPGIWGAYLIIIWLLAAKLLSFRAKISLMGKFLSPWAYVSKTLAIFRVSAIGSMALFLLKAAWSSLIPFSSESLSPVLLNLSSSKERPSLLVSYSESAKLLTVLNWLTRSVKAIVCCLSWPLASAIALFWSPVCPKTLFLKAT